ncbi:hypothetical protein AB205_0047500 [Aquarana catesbeiana]|uniref:Uncharacterized protein n=1 Tax=Aquarana catesbeiana TaxID=8400 RepID=A0A2G9RQJ0_AQUCT|nr:hypothetical protein AB205_0047500 [Aquarana catesbeiana]
MHAKELEFLRPLLALRRTENYWEDSTPKNVLDKMQAVSKQAKRQSVSKQAKHQSVIKQAKSLRRANCRLQHVLPLRHLWEMRSPHHPFVLVYLLEQTYMQQEGGLLNRILTACWTLWPVCWKG